MTDPERAAYERMIAAQAAVIASSQVVIDKLRAVVQAQNEYIERSQQIVKELREGACQTSIK